MEQDLEQQQATQPAAAAPTVEPVASTPAVAERQIDPNYVAQLEAFARQQQAELNRYESIKDVADWVAEDPTRYEGVKRYKSSWEEASKPKFDPTVEPVIKYIDEAIAPVRAYVTREELAATNRQKAENDRFVADNVAFANRLIAEKKIVPGQVDQLAAYADSLANRYRRNVTIEEAFKDMQSFGGGPKTEAAAAPVLRADSGAVGVPGPSQSDTKEWLTNFNGKLVDTLRAAQKTA